MFFQKIVNFIYPAKCVLCNLVADDVVCNSCYEKLCFFKKNSCLFCAVELQDQVLFEKYKCFNCLNIDLFFTESNSVFIYDNLSAQLLYKYKFQDCTYLVKYFAMLMVKFYQTMIESSDCLIPVPLHKKRMIVRKYNQSALLVRHIAKNTGICFDNYNLMRIKNTLQQYALPEKLRMKNVKNAFCVRNSKKIHNKTILLIDDVITTGATINECAKILLKNGAKQVNCLSLLRSIK